MLCVVVFSLHQKGRFSDFGFPYVILINHSHFFPCALQSLLVCVVCGPNRSRGIQMRAIRSYETIHMHTSQKCCWRGRMCSCIAAQTIFMVFWFKYTEFLFSLCFFFGIFGNSICDNTQEAVAALTKTDEIKMRPRSRYVSLYTNGATNWLTAGENVKCYAVVLILINP